MKLISLFFISIVLLQFDAIGQKSASKKSTTVQFPESAYDAVQWRFVGTHRGGRASGVCGVPGQPNVFYMAATGGGVWKTIDGGSSWENVSDGFFGGSIGAVRVSESDPNIVYAGCGEKTVRGNVSPGYGGVYRSNDAGKTWYSVGLGKHAQIGEIRIHPRDPNIAFVAVIGDLFKDSSERGLFKTLDGGKSWKKVLFSNERSGALPALRVSLKKP